MKTRRVVGYVAVVFACAYACGGPPVPSIPVTATDDAGGAESGSGGGGLTVTDARADHERDVATDRSESGAEADDDATNAVPTTGSQYCCMSGAYYVCPTVASLAQCPSNCMHDPSKDATCTSFDAGFSSGSSSTPALPSAPRNACGGYFLGTQCEVGGGCLGGGHCTQNACYPNLVGNPCTYATDCGDGNHCTAGCCASPAKGSACDAFWDCDSGTCTNGICQ